MGFFSKLWKGAKNVFKKIGKGIKKAIKSVGKFVGKLGLVGQIGLMFVLPGIGGMLGSMIGKGVTALAGSSNALLAGVGKVLTTAGKFAHTAGNAFKTVTDGITSFVSNIGKGMINKGANLIGKEAIFKGGPMNVTEGFQTWMKGVADDAANITSPFKASAAEVTSQVEAGFDSTFNLPEEFSGPKPTGMDPNFEIKFSDVKSMNMPEVNRSTIMKLADVEKSAFKRFTENTINYAQKTLADLPNKVMDQASESVTDAVVAKGTNALGLTQEPNYTVQNNTSIIPQFKSTPITNQYESAGIGYGATPDNRIQFFAAQQTPYTDFGMSSFNQFSQLRTV